MSPRPAENVHRDKGAGLGQTALTIELLHRAQQGDPEALARIMERYLPRLQRWASGRLPDYARSAFDTADVVQETLVRTLQSLDRLRMHSPGGFQAYVRQAVLNRIRDQVRVAGRRPAVEGVAPQLAHPSSSPLEDAIGADLLARYEHGMAQLDDDDRRLLHLRIELEFEFAEIAAMTDRPSADAARMAFQRALTRLSGAMGRG